MKYNEEQRQKLKNKTPFKNAFFWKQKKIKKDYPIEVHIEEGFYIIESKMNKK